MKKTLAIILSLVMLLCMMPLNAFAAEKTYDAPADAYAEYDRDKVASGDADYISSLTYDQMASILLDWVDKKIAKATEDFQTFEVEVMGQEIAVELDVSSIDGILSYSNYLTQLGGDFANLNTAALSGLSRKGGDINFIYGVLQFMADNASTFGKVFQWEEGQTFDFGEVGKYIEGLEDGDKIKTFYNEYLIGNDIQEKFIAEIAREMNYTVPTDENGVRTETFDEIISNGIVAWVAGLCESNGILSADGIEALKAYDLRTEDIYVHIKNFVALVQSDNQIKIDTYFRFLLDNYVRTALKVMFGSQPVAGADVADTALNEEFAAAYKDLAYLYEISGGNVYYQAADGAYYQVTVTADGAVGAVKALTWEDTMKINFEPPVLTVYTGAEGTADAVIDEYNCDKVQEYRPAQDYIFEVYSPYGDAFTQYGIEVAGAAAPETYTALMTEENAKAMRELFAFTVTGIDPEVKQVVTFAAIEALAEEKALEAAQTAAAQMNATVNSVDVTLNYAGYATEDEFITNVTASATANLTVMGMTIDQDVTSFMTNPVATIILDNLSGGLGVDSALELLEAVNSDFVIDTAILDIAGNYDAYNGAIGQVNRILCDIAEMLLSEEFYAQLALTEGGNENLTANVQKICDKFNEVMAEAEAFMNEEGFAEFVAEAGINDIFAEVGFNAEMIYSLDFSSVEALYVSLIDIVLDFADDGTEGTLVNDIHKAVDGLETLDAMAVAVTDYALAKYVPEVNTALADKGLSLTVPAATDAKTVTDGGAKDIIMTKLVDLAFEATTWAVDDLVNDVVNAAIDSFNTELELDIADVEFTFGVTKGADWNATLTAMVDRIYELGNGIIIVCGTYEGTDVFDRISAVANAILPMGSMFSNCAGNGFACDLNAILNTFIFDEALDGDFDNFLGLFETAEKTEDVAADVPVTYALIKASDHIVDAVFPDTVKAENYTASLTVQEEFTSGSSDVVIAANNMVSINNRKTHLVPAALDLVRESGLLPYFASCDHTSGTVDVPEVPATCTEDGATAGKQCAVCGHPMEGCETIPATGHTYGDWQTQTEATCTEKGSEIRECACGASETRDVPAKGHSFGDWAVITEAACEEEGMEQRECDCGETEDRAIEATGHTDADEDNACDSCGADLTPELSFFERIVAFLRSILEWFKSLFG